MCCRLQWFWSRACCCCSAWHWSAVAGTSPSDAPQDQPDLVQYMSLWRLEGDEKDECTFLHCQGDYCAHCVCVLEGEGRLFIDSKWICIMYVYFLAKLLCIFWCVFDLTTFTFLGYGGSSRTRTQTWALQGESFASETRLLLQLALQHKHICINIQHTGDIEKRTQGWRKMSYCQNIDQIFMRWPTESPNANLRLASKCTFQPLLAHKVRNSDPKDKA